MLYVISQLVIATVGLLSFVTAHSAHAGQPDTFLWQTNSEGTDIHVFQLGDFQLVHRLEVGPQPHGIAAPDDGRVVYVSVEANRHSAGELLWINPKRLTMNTAASNDPRIQDLRVSSDEIIARLADGRVISVPLAWSWRLSEATPKQRANFRLIGSGQGVHWPDVDEDISVEGMLHGVPAHRPRSRPAGADARGGGDHEPPNKRIQPTRGKRRAQVGSRGARG